MHNKRIGRDDLLKIEVCTSFDNHKAVLTELSGHVLPPLPPGDSTLDVTHLHEASAATVALAVSAPHAAVASPLAAVAVTTPPVAKTTAATATTTDEIATAAGPQSVNVMSRTIVIVTMTEKQVPMARNVARVRLQ
jgi:hypothetical protein